MEASGMSNVGGSSEPTAAAQVTEDLDGGPAAGVGLTYFDKEDKEAALPPLDGKRVSEFSKSKEVTESEEEEGDPPLTLKKKALLVLAGLVAIATLTVVIGFTVNDQCGFVKLPKIF